jgi:hypothetical protein
MTLDDDRKTSKLDKEKPSSDPSQRLSVQAQAVPRIPSFKFHERPFSGVFDDADTFSPDKPDHSRTFSQGHSGDEQHKSLKAVPEESYSFSTSSSITRRMLQSEGATEDNGSSLRHQQSVGPYSTDSDSSAVDVTDIKPIDDEACGLEGTPNQLERNIQSPHANAVDAGKEAESNGDAARPSSRERFDYGLSHEISSSALGDADQDSVEKPSSLTQTEAVQEPDRDSSNVRESQVNITGEHSPPLSAAPETPRVPTPAERKERSSLGPDLVDIADRQDSKSDLEPPKLESQTPLSSELEDWAGANVSQSVSTNDSKQELKASSQLFEEKNKAPRSLSMGNLSSLLPVQRARRLSSTSQISAIAQEEMDAIRDRLREAADSAPKSNQVSEIGEEEVNVLNRELDEASYQTDPEAPQSKQSNGLEGPHVPDESLSLADTSTERENGVSQRRRFSFESEEREVRSSDHQEVDALVAQSIQLEDIPDEYPPDEPPPPFDEPDADHPEDKKEEAEDAPPYDALAPSQRPDAQGLGISTVPHPNPQPSQGPPVHQPVRPLPAMQHTLRRKDLPQSHAHASPIPSALRLGNGDNRFYGSQLQGPPSQSRQGPAREQPVRSPAMQQSQGRTEPQFSPTITDPYGRGAGRDAGISPGQETTSTRNSFVVRRPHSNSQGSGDSMVANVGTSRLDLRAESSPLNQHTESPSPNTQPLKSKIKMMGKLHRMSAPGMDTTSSEGKKKTLALISVRAGFLHFFGSLLISTGFFQT